MRPGLGLLLFPLIANFQGSSSFSLGRSRIRSLSSCLKPSSVNTFSPSKLALARNDGLDEITQNVPKLVVLIPAYNEENRIESTLSCYQDFLLRSLPENIEPTIVVIDDGSSDATLQVVNKFPCKIPIQSVSMEENKGKGAALSRGVQHISENTSGIHGCNGRDVWILTQDADGSGDLVYLDGMMQKLKKLLRCDETTNAGNTSGRGIVIGNRMYDIFSSRGVTRWGFQTCVRILTSNGLRVKDTQCGYKLMTLSTAEVLYKDLNLKGWSHDVEVLFRAKLLNIPIDEMCIEWEDIKGSKVSESGIVKVSVQMLWDVIRLRWNYSVLKCWKLES